MIPSVIILAALPCLIASQTNDLLNFYQFYVAETNKSLTVANISGACAEQNNLYLEGLLSFKLWAIQMLDSGTKFPTGLLAGNFYDLGNFDECLNIETEILKGKYCLGTIPVSSIPFAAGLEPISASIFVAGRPRTLGNDPLYTGLHLATCVPDKCTAGDVTKMHVLNTFSEKYCYTRDTQPKINAEAIGTISVLGFFLVLVLLSTSYDVYLFYSQKKPISQLFIAFSWFTNSKKIFSSTNSPNQLLCLNGLRAISMVWIIAAHEYVNSSSGPTANYLEIVKFIQEVSNMFIISSTLAVDTFFVIGGLVIVYVFLSATEKGVKFNLILFYIHRYIRLTPAVAIVVLIHATLLKLLGDGPMWNSFDDHLVQSCRKHWWAALLYIQNYVHDEQTCVPQTWYLSVDMQLFLLSPLILVPMRRKPKLALLALTILSLCGIVVPFVIAYNKELKAFMITNKNETQEYMFSYYEQTYGRFGAYVIGMILGYVLHRIKSGKIRVNLNWGFILSIWIICLTGMTACVYAGHDLMLAEYNKLSHSLYIAFSRPAWALAISGIIFLCVTGYGGPVNALLSAPIFQVVSKLSYSIYLVHYPLILMRAASYRTTVYRTHFLMFFNFWGDFIFSLALAVILCLTFESPMIVIEKNLLGGCVSKRGKGKPNGP